MKIKTWSGSTVGLSRAHIALAGWIRHGAHLVKQRIFDAMFRAYFKDVLASVRIRITINDRVIVNMSVDEALHQAADGTFLYERTPREELLAAQMYMPKKQG